MRFKLHELVIAALLSVMIVFLTKPAEQVHVQPVCVDNTMHVEAPALLSAYESARGAIRDKDGYAHAASYADAVHENIRADLIDTLAPVVAAIRHAENGGAGREYGILHHRVQPTYRSQAGWCAATVQKNWDRYITAGGDPSDINAYIKYLGARYCPVGADNDPGGLNVHWVSNVSKFRSSITKE